MSRGPDAATQLERALAAEAGRRGCALALIASDATRWASATFAGMRHSFTLRARASPALDTWLAALPEHEFTLRGHLVADIALAQRQRSGDTDVLTIEALTVEA